AGFKVLINNRPDGEAPGQPTSAEFAAAAAENGLEYVYYPVTGMNFPGPDLPGLAATFENAEGPVLAFCRSGTRSINLWLATRSAE
ncbi:MAG TPA: TIGR01244 family phosphatase, partial [Haliea salexigens]|nr:TIGR01244 family phosphatase [Haliea salexigens]